MCATNLWAVNAAAFTPEFQQFTVERLGVEPEITEMSIASSRVRGSSVLFTLTRNMCDCSTLIGARQEPVGEDEASAEDWLAWLRELPEHVPHLSRLAILRAWNPEEDAVTPARARGIRLKDVTERVLRDMRDNHLLTIDYPRTVSS